MYMKMYLTKQEQPAIDDLNNRATMKSDLNYSMTLGNTKAPLA